MATTEVLIGNVEGLHARPAAELVRIASNAGLEVKLGRVNQALVPANSILAILGLGLRSGERITVTVTGPDEAARLAEIVSILA
ncbi:MAG: HPr family phosphocarrier protein [Actinomycetales bacterium]|nr:HPr family phosphocarrier protein [Actinomycetales bacterium]